MSNEHSPNSSSWQDLLATTPRWAAVVMVSILAAGTAGAVWVLFNDRFDSELHHAAGSVLTFVLPVFALTFGAVAASHGGTRVIDRLVRRFLDVTVLNKLKLMAADSKRWRAGDDELTFAEATLELSAGEGSYARYQLVTRSGEHFPLTLKMNVFNIEALWTVTVLADGVAERFRASSVVHANDLRDMSALVTSSGDAFNPFVAAVSNALQGAIAEGYVVRVSGRPAGDSIELSFGIRQKLRENFLTSPFLRRYFAEDIAIWMRSIFFELQRSPLQLDRARHQALRGASL